MTVDVSSSARTTELLWWVKLTRTDGFIFLLQAHSFGCSNSLDLKKTCISGLNRPQFQYLDSSKCLWGQDSYLIWNVFLCVCVCVWLLGVSHLWRFQQDEPRQNISRWEREMRTHTHKHTHCQVQFSNNLRLGIAVLNGSPGNSHCHSVMCCLCLTDKLKYFLYDRKRQHHNLTSSPCRVFKPQSIRGLQKLLHEPFLMDFKAACLFWYQSTTEKHILMRKGIPWNSILHPVLYIVFISASKTGIINVCALKILKMSWLSAAQFLNCCLKLEK